MLAAVLRSDNFHRYEEPEGRGQTIVLAPPECHEHKTSTEPVVRGGREPPPENVHRLHVLTDSGKAVPSNRCWRLCTVRLPVSMPARLVSSLLSTSDYATPVRNGRGAFHADLGILHSSEFLDLRWESSSQRAAMSDVLRVHEWAYVSLLQKASGSCTDSRFAALDSDTIISRGSFSAALAAAGAVTAAVDRLMEEQVTSALLCEPAGSQIASVMHRLALCCPRL